MNASETGRDDVITTHAVSHTSESVRRTFARGGPLCLFALMRKHIEPVLNEKGTLLCSTPS